MSRLVIMGSGETAPTMVRVHRQIFADSGITAQATKAGAVMLDTTFGFQNNAPDLVAKTIAYFVDTVGQPVSVAPWRRRDELAIDREKTLALLQQSRWAFAGPGSPTYALRHWIDTPIPTALADLARRGGTVVMGSAAAVTLGSHAIPVYEIYKAGEDPHWLPGIDLLGALTGLQAAVIPHYNNNEGGSYDTHFCYLGEQRLALMETQLPAETGVLGVDEHTALIFDLSARTATVTGNGLVTARHAGVSQTFAAGTVIGFAELAALLRSAQPAVSAPVAEPTAASAQEATAALPGVTGSLAGSADAAETAFQAALVERNVDGCVAAILGLDEAIHSWSADTLQSDDANYARRVLRSLIVQLGGVAEVGARDPKSAAAPFVDALLAVRATARATKDFATSDLVRDRLAAAGVEVRDTVDGVDWVLTNS